MDTLLEIKNVTKYYGGGDAVSKALNGVSFSMERGELTNTLKLRRAVVAENYREVIDRMYEE